MQRQRSTHKRLGEKWNDSRRLFERRVQVCVRLYNEAWRRRACRCEQRPGSPPTSQQQ